jgi:hypothetical protein
MNSAPLLSLCALTLAPQRNKMADDGEAQAALRAIEGLGALRERLEEPFLWEATRSGGW